MLFALAERNGVALPDPSTEDPSFESEATLLARYRRFTSLDDFLHYYFIGMSVLVTPADFEALAYAYFARAAADGVRHAEVFFDPQAHTARGVAYDDVVAGFAAAQTRARRDFALTSALIVCILRHLPAADGHAMYERALPHLEAGTVAGLGLSSTELGHPPHGFRATYADAERRGIRRTAHAGEEAGVEYMASALRDLHVTRVDHGIKLADDETLLREFVDRAVLVTVCPLSNVELRCVARVADLPLRTYLARGVRFSLNSDDPAYFGGYVLDNYCAVQDAFALSVAEWETVARHAIEGSWCDDARKRELAHALDDVLATFRDSEVHGL